MRNSKSEIRNPDSHSPYPLRQREGEEIETAMAKLLRAGVLLAAGITLFGGVLYLWQHGGAGVDYREFTGDTSLLRDLTTIIPAALALDPQGIIQLGILLLIAMPVLRVLFSLISYSRQRDRAYVMLSLIVLVVLLYGFLGGKV